MYDLFFTLGTVYFALEILFRAFDAYTITNFYIDKRDQESCENRAEQELINEIRKKK